MILGIDSTKQAQSSLNQESIATENCCTDTPIYEITYQNISTKWLVCNQCLQLDFFNSDIKEKVRVQT